MKRILRWFCALMVAGAAVSVTTAAPPAEAAVPASFTDTVIGTASYAVDLAFLPDQSMLVATKSGVVKVVKNGVVQTTPVLDLTSRLCSNFERGLLGIATDPAAATYVWVFYTARDAAGACANADNGSPNPANAPRNRVSRFTLRADGTADPASEKVLVDGIYSTSGYHNAGDVDLGKDGYLYIATGDGMCDYKGDSGCGPANDTARDVNVLNAKILRITKDGGIPADNPFLGAGTARCNTAPAAAGISCQETFAKGLRNPFRLAFDSNTAGTSFRINDVGQDVWDEIDQGVKGADYGWNLREGHCQLTNSETNCGVPTPAGLTDPIYDYGQGEGCSSITGGAFVPAGLWPGFNGSYLFADYACGKIFALSPTNVRTDFATGLVNPLTLEFGPDGAGQALYYTLPNEIHKISYTGATNRAPTAKVTAAVTAGGQPNDITFDGSGSSDPDGGSLSYTWTFGDGTAPVTTSTPTTRHVYAANGAVTATLKVTDPGGLSGTATVGLQIGNTAPAPIILSPTASQLFSVNGVYTLQGSATDKEDGVLPASALSWTVVKHHDSHTHPVLGPVSGASTTTITGPAPEDPASTTNSYLEIRLTATDSRGVSTTVGRDFRPRTVPVTLTAAPAGLKVTLNGSPVSTPTTFTAWAGWAVPVAAAAQTGASGRSYTFARWSDGGPASHSFATPTAAATLTATFTATGPGAPAAVAAKQSAAGSATLSWAPPTDLGGMTVTGYRISRDGKDSTNYGPYTADLGQSSRSVTFNRLVVGNTYNLTVQALTANGTGVIARAAVTIRAWTLPVAPTALTVTGTGPTTGTISWTPPGNNGGQPITGYRVTRDKADSAGAGPLTTVLPATATSFALTKLVAWRQYTVTVSAITAVGASPAVGGQLLVGSQQGVPAPTKVSVIQATATSATISWQPPPIPAGVTATGYTITRDNKAANDNGPYTTTVGASVRSVTVNNLVPGQTYTMTVKANTSSWFSAVATGAVVIR